MDYCCYHYSVVVDVADDFAIDISVTDGCCYYCVVRHGGALVESMTFNRRVVGLAVMQGPWTSPSLTVVCALRRETLIQYPCCRQERF